MYISNNGISIISSFLKRKKLTLFAVVDFYTNCIQHQHVCINHHQKKYARQSALQTIFLFAIHIFCNKWDTGGCKRD